MMNPGTSEHVRDVLAKAIAGTIFLTAEDCRAAYEELRGGGVVFAEEPEERPYGIDAAFEGYPVTTSGLRHVRQPTAV